MYVTIVIMVTLNTSIVVVTMVRHTVDVTVVTMVTFVFTGRYTRVETGGEVAEISTTLGGASRTPPPVPMVTATRTVTDAQTARQPIRGGEGPAQAQQGGGRDFRDRDERYDNRGSRSTYSCLFLSWLGESFLSHQSSIRRRFLQRSLKARSYQI